MWERDIKEKKKGKGLMNRRKDSKSSLICVGDLHEGEREFIVALTKITCREACQIHARSREVMNALAWNREAQREGRK